MTFKSPPGSTGREVRHQSSIARICASASGVVRTGRFTDAGWRVEDRRRRTQPTRRRRVPAIGRSFVQRAALIVREAVILTVRHVVDDRSLGQRVGSSRTNPALFDARSEWAHLATVGFGRARQEFRQYDDSRRPAETTTPARVTPMT